jgi:hypothetical protein
MASFMQRTIRGYNNPRFNPHADRSVPLIKILYKGVLALSVEDYLRLAAGQKDKVRRSSMKVYAYHVLYGSDPDALILMPTVYLDSVELDREPN